MNKAMSRYEYRFVNEHGEVWVAHINDDSSIVVTSNDIGWKEKIFQLNDFDTHAIFIGNSIRLGSLILGKNEFLWMFSVYLVAKELKEMKEITEKK